MSRDQDQDVAGIDGLHQLVDYFHAGAKAADARGIGTEHEKFLFRGADAQLTPFDGDGGIEHMLGQIAARYGWDPAPDRGRLVALVRGSEAVTLEPAGQLELSGAVTKTIFETREEFDRHIAELRAVAGPDYRTVSFGLNPWDDLYAVPLMPKARYGVMDRYLHTRGDLARWMMQGTCTIQANLDYTSEEDAASLVRTSVRLSPFVTAMFANSPLRLGKPTGMQSFRAHIWTRMDPDRCGVPDFMFRDDWGFADWVEWVLDVPMFFIRRDGAYVDISGRCTFRQFMAEGYEGHTATMGDFELHLSTVFPEVRLKRFVEMRSGDGGPREHVFALPAFWKGIGYSASARAAAEALLREVVTVESYPELLATTTKDGIHGTFAGRAIADWCADLLAIAGDGLDRIAARDGHPSEAEFLAPLHQIVRSRRSAADRLLADFAAAKGDRLAVVAARDLLTVDVAETGDTAQIA